jgi:hypothetical protein
MKFTLSQLYSYNKSKPFIRVTDIDGDLQWDECDLEGMPPQKTGMSVHDMGKTSIVPHEELQKIFKAIDGNEYFIKDIHTIWGGNK